MLYMRFALLRVTGFSITWAGRHFVPTDVSQY